MGQGKLIAEIFEAVAEEKLIQPTFVTEHPIEVSPLAKKKAGDPNLTERFELFICGHEYANAFGELNDPVDQAERFRAQVEAKDLGDDEAMGYDDDYVRALEYGMPRRAAAASASTAWSCCWPTPVHPRRAVPAHARRGSAGGRPRAAAAERRRCNGGRCGSSTSRRWSSSRCSPTRWTSTRSASRTSAP